MTSPVPTLRRQQGAQADARLNASGHQLWLRINAFLSTRSRNTQDTYSGVVREWCEFLGESAGTDKSAAAMISVSDLHALSYRRWLEDRPGEKPRLQRKESSSRAVVARPGRSERRDGLQSTLANATIAKKLAALRRIYRMLVASNLGLAQNPFDVDKVPPPAVRSGQKRPTEMIDFKLVKEILALPDPKTPKGVRDRAILGALFGGGLRRSEVCALRLGDVRRTQQGTIFLRLRATKAKKDADQALPAWAANSISDLIGQRIAEGAGGGDALFVGYRGRGGKSPSQNAISVIGLYLLFKAYCLRAGAGHFVTPHSARATAITKLLSDGISHREVQEFSRHSSVAMVEAYDKRRIGVDQNPGKDLDYK